MLASQLIHTTFPVLSLQDKALFALQLMEDYDVTHLPVSSEEKFVGIVKKDDLLDIDETAIVAAIQENFIIKCVKEEEHFLAVLKLAAENSLALVPVINLQSEIIGSISINEILLTTNTFLGNDEPGGIIVLEMDRRNFSFGELSRLVETNDAYVTQLNTSVDKATGLLFATIKVSKNEISDIIATFQRYDYTVKYYFGEEQYANELKDNYNHLMAYINM